MYKLEIKKGSVYGNLTVLKEGKKLFLPSGQVNRTVDCICSCGNETNVRIVHLVRNRIKSCGCILRTKKGKSKTDYGILLNSLKTRCKKNYTESHLYYYKGITVYNKWLEDIDLFIDFCKKNGYKKGLQIDRIDNSKGYYPENCRFVTSKINTNNRDNTVYVTYKGEKKSLQLLCMELGLTINVKTIYSRLKRNWSLEDALFKPLGKNYSGRNKKELNQ